MPNSRKQTNRFIFMPFNSACLLSLAGVTASVFSMILSVRGMLELALVGLVLAGLADLFDGALARRLKLNKFEKEYGVQLDTVIDAVSFVATPVVIALSAGLTTFPMFVGLALFVVAGVLRLAHFNTLSRRGQASPTHHRGLPVTYTALILPLAFLFQATLTVEAFHLLLALLFPFIGLLFVVNVPIRKPRGIFYIILPLLAVGLIAYWVQQFLLTSGGA